MLVSSLFFFFFFNDTATTEIYTLSLHDALPIWAGQRPGAGDGGSLDPHRGAGARPAVRRHRSPEHRLDRKSTRLNSSHSQISYAVFCLKKKKTSFNLRPAPNTDSPATPSTVLHD